MIQRTVAAKCVGLPTVLYMLGCVYFGILVLHASLVLTGMQNVWYFVFCTHLVSVHIELGLDYKSQFCIQMCSSQMHHVVCLV